MKRQRNTTQIKEQTRNTDVQINEEKIGKLPEKEFRKMIVKMIKNLESFQMSQFFPSGGQSMEFQPQHQSFQ